MRKIGGGMKVIMEFDRFEDSEELDCAMHGSDYKSILFDLQWGFLRNALKYGHTYKTAEEAMEATRDYIHEQLEERSLRLD
jgi:hypothetical protein